MFREQCFFVNLCRPCVRSKCYVRVRLIVGIDDRIPTKQDSRQPLKTWPMQRIQSRDGNHLHRSMTIPYHMLTPSTYTSSATRAYSSKANSDQETYHRKPQRNNVTESGPTRDEHQDRASETEPSTVASIASNLGFQSLSALFHTPPVGRYSRSRQRPEQTEDPDFVGGPATPKAVEQGLRHGSPSQSADVHNLVQSDTTTQIGGAESPTVPIRRYVGVFDGRNGDSGRSTKPNYQSNPHAEDGERSARPPTIRKVQRQRSFRDDQTQAQSRGQPASGQNLPLKNLRDTSSNHTDAKPLGQENTDVDHAEDRNFPKSAEESFTKRDNRQELTHNEPKGAIDPMPSTESTETPQRPWGLPTKKIPETRPQSAENDSGQTSPRLTHVNSAGQAHMVDVSDKIATHRTAIAIAFVRFTNDEPFRLISENSNQKGDVLGTARIAGIMAAKRCADIIPLCHPIAISKVKVNLDLFPPWKGCIAGHGIGKQKDPHGSVSIETTVQCYGPTGVEMEALTAATAAALTVYDMCKAVDRGMTIAGTRLVYKDGGKSGKYVNSFWEQKRADIADINSRSK